MPTIYIENKPYEVPAGQNVLHACLSLGFNLPYFCWHPGMHSIGACRQCAVKHFKDENDKHGRVEMACMLHASDGTRVSISDPDAAEFRTAVCEWLMTNHPHDCPVCDEGGECHLQDMVVMTGHNYRRYRYQKRTHRNQDLGPFINHEMNRCIACYRCVRFYNDYAGGRDLTVLNSHNHIYFGRDEDGVLESEFSGNLIEVCPTGVFTDKTLKEHFTRKWDLQTAPSVCAHCSVGCNTIPGERYGTLRRIRNRYNEQVNGYWLCDRGRFGYEFVNDPLRIRQPLVRSETGRSHARQSVESPPSGDGGYGVESRSAGDGGHGVELLPAGDGGYGALQPVERSVAVDRAAELLRDSESVIGIGSPRASLEANFALRTLVGPDRFYCGLSDQHCRHIESVLKILQQGPARSPSLADIGDADVTLILGEDISNTAPLMALAIRQAALSQEMSIAEDLHIPAWQDAAVREAIQKERGPVFIATPSATRLDDLGTQLYRAAPDDIARLGFAIAHALSDESPAVDDLPQELTDLAQTIADALRGAKRPLIVSGTSLENQAILQAAANVAWALCAQGLPAELSYAVPECNSLGMGLLGNRGIDTAWDELAGGRAETLVILENDLYRRADAATIDKLFSAAKQVIVIDHLPHPTMARADIVFPAATFAEGDGTLINNEGRAQRSYQVFVPAGEVQESWRWLRDLMTAAGNQAAQTWSALDDITASLAASLPVFADLSKVAPSAAFRIAGEKIPRQPHRYSGRTAMHADVDVSESPPPNDPDSPLAFSMEGYQGQPPPELIAHYWTPGWNSVQALNKFQEEVGGSLKGGDSGHRLIEPSQHADVAYFKSVPKPFYARDDQWLAVPLYHVFGSEELSARAPAVAKLVPGPYVAVSPDDAKQLGVDEGGDLELLSEGLAYRWPVKIDAALARGVMGLPAGLPQTATMCLPKWVSLLPIKVIGGE